MIYYNTTGGKTTRQENKSDVRKDNRHDRYDRRKKSDEHLQWVTVIYILPLAEFSEVGVEWHERV